MARRVIIWILTGVLTVPPGWIAADEPWIANFLLVQGDDVLKARSQGAPGQPLVRESLAFPPEDLSAEPPETAEPSDEWEQLGGNLRAAYLEGNLVGQDTGFGSVGIFRPWMLDDGLWFVDGQITVDHFSNVGGNLGAGRRWYLPQRDAVFGLHVFFDADKTSAGNVFTQLSSGLMWCSDRWKLDADAYVPLENARQSAGAGTPLGLGFAGNNFVQQVEQPFDVALTGLEMTLSRRLFDQNLWVGAGWYHFQGGGEQTYGVKGALGGWLTENVLLETGVTDDPLFGTNGYGAVTWFYGRPRGLSPNNVFQNMRLPVARRSQIAVARQTVRQTEVLTQGGQPITVTHVDDHGAGLGQGTVERPYGSLNDATGSSTDIVYLHADSVFSGQQYAAASGQRVLGEAQNVQHLVQTDQLGQIVFPHATTGTAAPIVQNVPAAFQMNSSTELSGITIANANIGVTANSVNGNIDIQRVTVQNPAVQGVFLHDVTGTVRLDQVAVQGGATGIDATNVAGLVVTGGTLTNNGIGFRATDVNLLSIRGLQIQGSAAESMLLSAGGANVMHATVANNVMTGSGAPSSFQFDPNVGAVLNVNLFGNEDSAGFLLERDLSGQLRLGGSHGVGNFFPDDNNNIHLNGNTTFGGAPAVFIQGAGNLIEIIDPSTVLQP